MSAPSAERPFAVLGIQQVAIGGRSKAALRTLWVEMLGLEVTGSFRSERENVDEDICALGSGATKVEVDLMEPIDPEGQARGPRDAAQPHRPVDRRPAGGGGLALAAAACASRPAASARVRRATTSASSIPRANEEFPIAGEGVLIELVQAPPEVVAALDVDRP